MAYTRISIDQAEDLIRQGEATILDIRDAGSYGHGHIENAINVSDSNVEAIINSTDKTKPLVIYCYHGNSSQNAAAYFFDMGFEKACSVDGGYEEWRLKL